ncbi:hypothetical protein RFI_11750 [Reticulomyxa filosa]|uniref:Uncharacterized protein n=1 Tax=Reticulomyxa filosa TaxID=46433 RepID=X6NHP2_RETFI|nr:hypothetical protein RFI_11750 [Reticulomyxa filosa]|eukprot:ETO25388.1 hypothetical protein RFI_11750 [Reticulomyxa filosa]
MQSAASAGSFWTTTDYGLNLLMMEKTELDLLLESDDTTLEEVMDCDELLQQYVNLKKMINYVTQTPEKNVEKIIEERNQIYQQKQKKKEEADELKVSNEGHGMESSRHRRNSSLKSIPEDDGAKNKQKDETSQATKEVQAVSPSHRSKKKKKKGRKSSTKGIKPDSKVALLMWNMFHGQPLPFSSPDQGSEDQQRNQSISSHSGPSSAIVWKELLLNFFFFLFFFFFFFDL